jgi:hypothetical protein
MKGMYANRILCGVNLYWASGDTHYSMVHITDWHVVKRGGGVGG